MILTPNVGSAYRLLTVVVGLACLGAVFVVPLEGWLRIVVAVSGVLMAATIYRREGLAQRLAQASGPVYRTLRNLFWARLIHMSASFSAPSVCWFSHRLKASLATPDTKATASREDKRSLVWPENCGSSSLEDST